jgi:hypothetical protein
MNEVIFACIIITVICIYLLFVRSYFTPPVDEEKHCRRNFRVCYVTFEGIFYLCCGFFFGTAARGTLQDVKRERPKSRFAAV